MEEAEEKYEKMKIKRCQAMLYSSKTELNFLFIT